MRHRKINGISIVFPHIRSCHQKASGVWLYKGIDVFPDAGMKGRRIMNIKAGIAGILVGLMGVPCLAFETLYSGIAMPGTGIYIAENGTSQEWNAIGRFNLVEDYTWQKVVELTNSSGAFKFAANGSWDSGIAWGGNVFIQRANVRATAPNTAGGSPNITYTDMPTGEYLVTFNEVTLEFTMVYQGSLPLPSVSSVHLAGGFNNWTSNVNYAFTNIGGTVWELEVEVSTSIEFQFLINGTNLWGGAQSTTFAEREEYTDYFACGGTSFSLFPLQSGRFRFTLDTQTTEFSITQTELDDGIRAMTVLGNFVTNSTIGNMQMESDTLWASTHDITNTASITGIRFIGNNDTGKTWGAVSDGITVPQPGTVELMPNSTYGITFTDVVPGRYRITFDTMAMQMSLTQVYTTSSGANLLANPSFESVDGQGNAVGWSAWHSEVRDSLAAPPHSGSRCGALNGNWFSTEDGTYPSYSQDVSSIISNVSYQASAWVRKTADWTADSVQIRLEWRNADNQTLDTAFVAREEVKELQWSYLAIESIPPAETVTAHLVIMAQNAGTMGALLIDDTELRILPARTLDFNQEPINAVGTRYYSGWEGYGSIASNAAPPKPTGDVMITKYIEGTENNKAIEIFNGTTNRVRFEENGGYFLQQFNNGSFTPSVSIPLTASLNPDQTLVVSRPNTGPYPPTNTILNSTANAKLQTNALTFNGDDVIVLRKGGVDGEIVDAVGTMGMVYNSIAARMTKDQTLQRKSFITNASPVFNPAEWNLRACNSADSLGEHELTNPYTPYMPSGNAFIFAANGGYLESGAFSGGVGDISFWAISETAMAGTVEVHTSEDGVTWQPVQTFAINTAEFTRYIAGVDSSSVAYIKLVSPGAAVRIDDIAVSEYGSILRFQPFETWTLSSFQSMGTHTLRGWTIDNGYIVLTNGVTASRAAALSPRGGAVITPAYSEGIGEVVCWAKPFNIDPEVTDIPDATVLVQLSTDGGATWATKADFPISGESNLSFWMYSTNSATQVRFTLEAAEDAWLLLDNIEARIPALYRNQNFNAWPYRSGYTSETYQGWSISDCQVKNDLAVSGQAAQLNSSGSPYVLSPELPDGIGAISFEGASHNSSPNATIQVQTSPNGSTWTSVATCQVTSAEFKTFGVYVSNTTARYVRFMRTAGNSFTIDNITIGTPAPRPTATIAAGTDPTAPAIGENVRITADVWAENGATILSVSNQYRIGSTTWRPYTPMTEVAYGSYQSPDAITGLSAGIQISYRVSVTYAGFGAAEGATGYSTNTITTAVQNFRISDFKRGTIWINELAYNITSADGWEEDHEFIELCGVAGSDISGWQIQLALGSSVDIGNNNEQAVYATYTISNNTILANTANGFGFFVLGDTTFGVDLIDMPLTIFVPDSVQMHSEADRNHIHNSRGIIRLLDQYGNLVYSIVYAGFSSGSEPAGNQNWDTTNSLSLAGSGSAQGSFSWSATGAMTIGQANVGQTLIPPIGPTLAEVWHIPGEYIDTTASVEPFYMRDPADAQSKDTLYVHYGYTNAMYTLPAGWLYFKYAGAASWSSNSMSFLPGSLDADGHAYVRGSIGARSYSRGSPIEYVIAAIAGTNATTYIGQNGTVGTLEEATPFAYTYAVKSEMYIDSFRRNGTNWIFETGGNELPSEEPFTSFYIRFTHDLGTAMENWATNTSFTVTPVNEYGSNTFTVPMQSDESILYYRIDSRW